MENGVDASMSTLLHQALGSVYEGTMPFLRKTVDLGCKAVDAGAGGRGMDAFKRLAGDFGKFFGTPRSKTMNRANPRRESEGNKAFVEANGSFRWVVM